MTVLSNIITPTNVLTASSTNTLTNKTISGSNNTVTNVSLTTGVTGTLPVANGGTGSTSLTANNVLLGNGTSAVQVVAPGTSGNVLTSNGTTWTSSTPSGSANIQTFTSSGTWTKPAGASFVMVEAWGGGGGGGSGKKATSGVVNGGTGGGGGAYAYRLFKASDLSATETITIGAGGAGGAAQASTTDGNNGSNGGDTSFGTKLYVGGGGGGVGGTSSTDSPGLGGGVLSSAAYGGLPNSATSVGHFGAGQNGYEALSGFGGGSGGRGASGQGTPGLPSYQGGPGGGAGGGRGSDGTTYYGNEGGGIYTSTFTDYSVGWGGGAIATVYPGAAGANGSGRQGAGGGASGYVNYYTSQRYSLYYGNSTFALTNWRNGLIYKSSNGTTWTTVAGPSNTPIIWMLHDGTQWVLFGYNCGSCWTTTDFSTYTQKTGLSESNTGQTYFYMVGVKYAGGKYFIWSSGRMFYSNDLNSWTETSTGAGTSQINDICYSGTNWVVVSSSSPYVRYSSNLTSWSTATGTSGAVYTCASNGSGRVVINTDASPYSYYSTNNGASFTVGTTVTTMPSTNSTLNYVNGIYVFAVDDALYSSTDGITWSTRITAGSGIYVRDCAWDGTTYVIGIWINLATSIARTSTTLNTWTTRTITAVNTTGGAGGTGGQPAGGGGGGGTSFGSTSGAGGAGGAGQVIVYTW